MRVSQKALMLVRRWARLTRGIKASTMQIARHLEACPRQAALRAQSFNLTALAEPPDVHLKEWYGRYRRGRPKPATLEQECPACWAAHLEVEKRLALRRQLIALKGAMSKFEPEVIDES